MASLVQTGISTGAGRMLWALEQRFPKPPSTFGRADHLVRLQSVDPEVGCVLYSDNLTLSSAHGTTVWFRIVPSPLQPRFVVELRFGPSHSQTIIAASFAAYDDSNGNRRLQNRTPHVWTGTHGNVAPRGPLDFSRQLFQVMFRTGADPGRSPLNIHGVEPAAQLNFSWQSDTCTRYGFGHPRVGLSADVAQAIDRFKAILDQATTRGTRIGVVTKNSPRIPTLFWPWFCCQPCPTVPSWWPWLQRLNPREPTSIMNFSTSNFELDTAYINKAFGVRPDGWYLPGAANPQNVNNVPQPLSIAKLPAVSRFCDHREYLAHILGSHSYEHANDKEDKSRLLREIIRTMTGNESFWKSWLLAQDNHSLNGTTRTENLPRDWQQQTDEAINRARLNVEQAQVVRNYLQQRVTIVVGPAGTGKSTLVEFIIDLEKVLGCQSQGLIMNEASRHDEASTVSSILYNLANRDLRRVLIIGDHNQLSPTLTANRNPFSATGSMSLLKRQILAGTPHIQLRTQFRMHPSISRVLNLASYDNTLLNAAITEQRWEVDQFKHHMRTIASDSGLSREQAVRLNTCSFIMSPEPYTTQFPHFGSQVKPDSPSRYNLQTAMMVFRTVFWLIRSGGFRPQDLLVTAFYDRQVALLRALFAEQGVFEGLQIKNVEDSQGQERLVHIVDCVSMGGGAGESMGLLGGDRRRFTVAMSRRMVGRIVMCSRDFVKGTNHNGAWKELLQDPQTVILGDRKFRTAWLGEEASLWARFDRVRRG